MLLALILFFSHLIKQKISKKKTQNHKNLAPENLNILNSKGIVFNIYKSARSFRKVNLGETVERSIQINDNQPEESKTDASQPEESKVVVLPPPRITQISQKNKTNN